MKRQNIKDKKAEIVAYIVSVVMISLLMLTVGSDKISFAAASIMLYSPEKNVAVTETKPPEVQKSQTKEEAKIPFTPLIETEITKTPDDILETIKKYTLLLADDKKGGNIKETIYGEIGATHIFQNIRVKNTTETKELDIQKVLNTPLGLEIDKSKPAVLIFHSHTSEGYELTERDFYAENYNARSNDENLNVVRVGTEIADYLTKLGYTVIHDKTIHDDNYSDSYPNSRKTVEKHLEEYPEIQIILDIHRDSITLDNGTRIRPVSTINGQKAAQLMIITGAEEGKVADFPEWEHNLRFALELQRECETFYPGLMRPVLFSQRKYNMDLTRCSLLVEMGSEANTLEQACYSGRLLAKALASLMERYTV